MLLFQVDWFASIHQQLTLRVLWGLASALQAWLLAFLHAWIACQEACFAQGWLRVRIHAHQGACQGVTDRARLPGCAAADNTHGHCVAVAQIEHAQRRSNRRHMRITCPEIRVNAFSIDDNGAITIGEEAHAGYSRLAPSHAIVILAFDGIGQGRYSSPLVTLLEQPLLAAALTMRLDLSRGLASVPGVDVSGLHKF